MNELPLIDAAYPEQIQTQRSLLWPVSSNSYVYAKQENTQHKLALNIEGYYLTEKPDKLAV